MSGQAQSNVDKIKRKYFILMSNCFHRQLAKIYTHGSYKSSKLRFKKKLGGDLSIIRNSCAKIR